MPIDIYIHQFSKLRRAPNGGGAPHKPILLLAICNLVSRGLIVSRRIDITPELTLEFNALWQKLVTTNHIPTFSLPFFHLRTEPFWTLLLNSNTDIPQSISSLGVLRKWVAAAYIDEDLFLLMSNRLYNELLKNALLDLYFSGQRIGNFEMPGLEIQNQILNEDAQHYELRIESLEKTMSAAQFEEELFVRGGVFKKVVPRIYDYRCAVSGMRIETTVNAQMVDACHIIPFSESKDDTISNGISLCPNLHRAFDRGLIRISGDYRVAVSPFLKENDSVYAIGQFAGREIILPEEERYWPGVLNLVGHGRRWGWLF